MKRCSRLIAGGALLAVLKGAVPASAQPPGPPAAPHEHARPRPSEADVRFMQGMIPHHAQALQMAALVPSRSTRRDLRLLAERIAVSQGDEIAWMSRWLLDRGAEVPDPHAHHRSAEPEHHALMPGMLSPEEMERLAATSGPPFDRLFLESMIRHHEGALAMVAALLASEGAAQAPEVFRFASDVEADQRAEIRRMSALLGGVPAPPPATPHHH